MDGIFKVIFLLLISKVMVNICSFCDISDGEFVEIFFVGLSGQFFCLLLSYLEECVFLFGCNVLEIYVLDHPY